MFSSMTLLVAKNVTKDFGGIVALKDVSISVEEGELVGLIGPNGAGKSTLFNIITATYQPTSGRVLLEGRDITRLKPHDIVKLGISRTFQSVRPFLNYTVEENVKLGAIFGHVQTGMDVDEKVRDVLKLTGLLERQNLIAGTLPIEERKLVEVARALASSPKLLLLDEPMAGLNPAETRKFMDLVRKVNDTGAAVLLVEHVMKAVMSLSKRIIVIHSGQKIAEGSPKSILENEQVIKVYLGEEYGKSRA